jgi:hypothetical protein
MIVDPVVAKRKRRRNVFSGEKRRDPFSLIPRQLQALVRRRGFI